MNAQLTQEQTNLAHAIEKAHKKRGPLTREEMTYNGIYFGDAMGYIEQAFNETFTPNLIDPLDKPIGTKEEVRWWLAIEVAQDLLPVA